METTIDFTNISDELLAEYIFVIQQQYLTLAPDADVSIGSNIYELVIRPTAAILASNEVSLDTLRQNYSLQLLAESDNPDDDMADKLAANFRLTRKEGSRGHGVVSFYSKSSANVYISAGTIFDAGGVEVTTEYTYVGIKPENIGDKEDTDIIKYRPMIQFDANTWVFTVPVVTLENTPVSVESGVTVTSEITFTDITKMEVASAIAGGSGPETTQELVERVRYGITAKVPSGKAHIEALMTEADLSVLETAVFGMGDPEMLRDRNNPFLISTGGRVDACIKTLSLPATSILPLEAVTEDGLNWTMFVDRSVAPGWYYIDSIVYPGHTSVITDIQDLEVFYSYQQAEYGPEVFSAVTARYSIYQTARVNFKYAGTDFTGPGKAVFMVTFNHMPNLEPVQEFFNDPAIRSNQQDLLVKAPVAAFLSLDIRLKNTGTESTIDIEALKNHLAISINNFHIGRGFISAADLAIIINQLNANLLVSCPLSMTLSTYLPDGTVYAYTSTNGMVQAHEDLEQGVTAKNTAFFCKTSDINIEVEV